MAAHRFTKVEGKLICACGFETQGSRYGDAEFAAEEHLNANGFASVPADDRPESDSCDHGCEGCSTDHTKTKAQFGIVGECQTW